MHVSSAKRRSVPRRGRDRLRELSCRVFAIVPVVSMNVTGSNPLPRFMQIGGLVGLALGLAAISPAAADPQTVTASHSPRAVRFATFNCSLHRAAAGSLVSDLSTPDDLQARTIAEIIQRVRPDVVLLNEFDYDAKGEAIGLFKREYLQVGQNGAEPIEYPHFFVAPVNTGIPSGLDLDNDGVAFRSGDQYKAAGKNPGGDSFGFGAFPGQYGMAVLSRHPISIDDVRTFQTFRWNDLPDTLLPRDWYDQEEAGVVRLSSKSHWDVPIEVRGRTIHLLCSHPTPPVFDGPEDRNGKRNADEIRFWAKYIGPDSAFVYDDAGARGGLDADAAFVILGDLNSDPHDGGSRGDAIARLLEHPRINTARAPASDGAEEASRLQGGENESHSGEPRLDTADFNDRGPGNLRVDYVLPSANLEVLGSGVFWPRRDDPLSRLTGEYPFPGSDHRLVWIDAAP